ncbi:MAG: hypothetical protein K2X47_16195, partial [Bdellovibrionales bacterium]|nr:hypothetical protein [Bdellovibrionales bacterium]
MADPIVVSLLIFASAIVLVASAMWFAKRPRLEIPQAKDEAQPKIEESTPPLETSERGGSAAQFLPAASVESGSSYDSSFSKTREGLWGRLQGLWSQKTLDFVE